MDEVDVPFFNIRSESKQSLRNLQLRCEEAERESRESHTKSVGLMRM